MTAKTIFLFVSAVVGIAAATGLSQSGRIVGGEDAAPNEFPSLVAVRLNGQHLCSGAILSEEWIITAAHCALGRPADVEVTAGDHDLSGTEGTEQTRHVVRNVIHPLYNSDEAASFEYDIAIMQVNAPFVFNDNVQPSNLPTPGFAPTGNAVIAGWGSTSEQGETPSVLQKANVEIVEDEICTKAYGENTITENMVCAGGKEVDFCVGDSGGPLLCDSGSTTNVHCGVMSWGLGCGRPNFPGVYTETSFFTEWFKEAVLPEPEDNSTYVEQREGCGGNLVGSSGLIAYKLNSTLYNERCTWSVRANMRDTVRVTVNQSTGLDEGAFIEVTEVDLDTGKTGPRIILNLETPIALVSGPLVLITFVSNHSVEGGDFTLLFQGLGEQGSEADLVLSHHHLGNETGTLNYPIGGGQYSNFEFATFVINPPSGFVTLKFESIDLEGSSSSCTYDGINIHTHNPKDGFLFGSRICGTTPPSDSVVSDGVILLIFTTDLSVTGSGFNISWSGHDYYE